MPHHSSSDSDIWTFNLNDYAGFDSQSDDNEQGSSAKDHIGSDFQLMKTFDLSSREDTAKYVPNPWAIAKANAACRGIVKNSVEETSTPKTKNGSSDTILASAANTSEHPLPGTKVSLNTPKGVHSHGRSEAENISRRTPASNTTKQRSIPARKPICPFHVRSSNRTPVTPIITSTASFERSSVPAIRNSAHKNPLTAHDLSNAVDVSPMLAEPDKQSPTLALYNTRLDTGVIPATPVGPRSTHRTRRMPLRAFHTPRSATISDDLSFVHPENRRGTEKHEEDRCITPFTSPPSKALSTNAMSASREENEPSGFVPRSLKTPARRFSTDRDSSPPNSPIRLNGDYLPVLGAPIHPSLPHQPPPSTNRRSPHKVSESRPSIPPPVSPDPLFSRLKPSVLSCFSTSSKKRPRNVPAYSFLKADDDDTDEWSTLPKRKRARKTPTRQSGISGKFSLPISLPRGKEVSSLRKVMLYKPPPLLREGGDNGSKADILQLRKACRADAEELSRVAVEKARSVEKLSEDRYAFEDSESGSAMLEDVPEDMDTQASSRPSSPSPSVRFSFQRTMGLYPNVRKILKQRKKLMNKVFDLLDLESCGVVYRDGMNIDEIQIMSWPPK